MEVTFDPSAGDAFVSRNGQALDNQEPVSSEEELVQEPSITTEQTTSATFEEPEEIDQLSGFSELQRDAINSWPESGIYARAALEWAVSDESGLNQETITRMGHHLQNEDPAVVGVAMGALAPAQQRPDIFDLADENVGTEWSQEQEHELVDCVGGAAALEIINLNYRINSGEITRAEAFRYVATNPELQNAYLTAANAGVLVIHI